MREEPPRITERPAHSLLRTVHSGRWCYADNPLIARAAFKATVQQYPKEGIQLRNRALILEENKPR